ncbi:dihydrofolate reductase [Perilla frutescens var. hirtella]|uniref:Dihydrofolate reductase n=1 Tax=Perilla frutescens var. hirtella TaxID=608512 RepID=A0AAD4PCP9_PERFH|nr:dihydrofolate reductase [Perilla frutescens var. hirtella]
MGSEGGAEIEGCSRKLRLLCLHGFRTSGEIIKKQVTGKWPESVLEKLDLVFVDAPFPCQGKSDVEGIFDPPYYEWFQFNKDFTDYENFDECLAYIEDFMIKHGPFDGLLGFSQGAILSAGLAGMQANGVALTRVPKIKLVVIIGGAKFRNPSVVKKAYASPIPCSSVHFLGDQDFLKEHGTELLDSFVDPLVIRHPKGHTIPRFDVKGLESMLGFLERMQRDVEDEKQEIQISLENDVIQL